MDIKLPKLGEGAESGTVVNVLVNEGDHVAEGQTIVELETEKAVAPIPAAAAGVVSSVRVKVGDKVSVGQILLTLAGIAAPPAQTTALKSDAQSKRAPGARKVPVAAPITATPETVTGGGGEDAFDSIDMEPAPEGEPPPASPSIRRMARELGIDLRRVRGSERGGRIVFAALRA